jgi:hypothetical protein
LYAVFILVFVSPFAKSISKVFVFLITFAGYLTGQQSEPLIKSLFQDCQFLKYVKCGAVESESEGILGGVGVGRNFRWSRNGKEF